MSKKIKQPEVTNEEYANKWKNYYEWLKTIYPMEAFELEGRDKETLLFHRGINSQILNDSQLLNYYLIDRETAEQMQELKDLRLKGEDISGNNIQDYEIKGFISINKDKKYFNFGVEKNYQRHGYGMIIYQNYLHILEMLGIEDKEQYELRVYGNPKHDFFKVMATKELIARTDVEPNEENARQILVDFSKYPNSMRFSEFNSIIEYAIKSGVSIEEVAKAINDNGFNIIYGNRSTGVPRLEKEDFEKFKSFGITGLKATCMHHHFVKDRTFGFMALLGDVEAEDATLEFRRILEEVKKRYKKSKDDGTYVSPNIEQYGELEHIILDWNCFGLLLRNVDPEVKDIIKRQAIAKFAEFDPEHSEGWEDFMDSKSNRTLVVLRDAGLMDKDTYIELYQKALNRNYDLSEFDRVASRFIDREERKLALEEIAQNTYYPSPKGKWQSSSSFRGNHRIPKAEIPQRVSKKGRIRDLLKQEILRQGIAKSTKIKTDMTGIGKDGRIFTVDNLKDWMFGVPGATGNLHMMGTTAITFPPQTPEFAVELVEQALKNIEYPDYGER